MIKLSRTRDNIRRIWEIAATVMLIVIGIIWALRQPAGKRAIAWVKQKLEQFRYAIIHSR